MGTNGTDIGTPTRLEHSLGQPERTALRKRVLDARAAADREYERSAGEADPALTSEVFALAPLVDKIAWGIARGLVVAVKELEEHIASETRKVGDAVDNRLDTVRTALEELSRFVGDQRGMNTAVQGQIQELSLGLRASESREAADIESLRKEAQESSESIARRIDTATAALQESDIRQAAGLGALQTETRALAASTAERIDVAAARHASDLAALQTESRSSALVLSDRIDGLNKELGVQQEDIGAIKGMISTFTSRVDALAERLDRQAETVRSMCTAYSQRETELGQLVDGLARLRAFPTPLPANGL